MYDTISRFSLAANLAAAGTITVAYPTGRSKGNYSNSTGRHRLVVSGSGSYTAPKDFTLTFNANASNITLTWGAGKPTLAAGTVLTLQLERSGQDDGRPNDSANALKMAAARLWEIDLGSPNAAASNNVAASQSVAAAASFVLNGVLLSAVSPGRVIFDVPRNIVGAWTTNSILTITGKDEYGNTMVEVGASAATFTGKKAFKEITSVSSSASITSATLGTGVVFGLPVFLPSVANIVAELQDGVYIYGQPAPVRLPFYLEQVSVLAGSTAALELISPVAGVITGMTAVVRVAVGTGGTITAAVATTAVDGLSITVANSATKGTTASDTPTAGHASTVVAKNSRIQIIPEDAFATSGAIDGFIEIQPVGTGTILAGAAAAKQSGTTGDVRGTYAPVATPDGSIGFKLLVSLPDPSYKGDDQFAG